MADRIDFHNQLLSVLGSGNVYFQPPPEHQIAYPCIIYSQEPLVTDHANNETYSVFTKYTVTVIDSDPDSELPLAIARLSRSKPSRNFRKDGLNHYAFTVFA